MTGKKVKTIGLEAIHKMDLLGSSWIEIRARLTSGDNSAIIQKSYDMGLDYGVGDRNRKRIKGRGISREELTRQQIAKCS